MIRKIISKLKRKAISEEKTVQQIFSHIGKQVYTGPFAGLKIPPDLVSTMKLSEILGLYESCLHPVISSLISRNIENIMVIGGHKGYYPAGLSNLLRPKNMFVYEMDEIYYPRIESWININQLSPYIMGKEATDDILENFSHPVDFLLIDCEGAEISLLQPERFIWQQNSDILVEIHHFYNHKILGDLISRFKNTHDMQIIYDDINENNKIENVMNGLGVNGSFRSQPYHRWIFDENRHKIITAGIFLYLKKKTT